MCILVRSHYHVLLCGTDSVWERCLVYGFGKDTPRYPGTPYSLSLREVSLIQPLCSIAMQTPGSEQSQSSRNRTRRTRHDAVDAPCPHLLYRHGHALQRWLRFVQADSLLLFLWLNHTGLGAGIPEANVRWWVHGADAIQFRKAVVPSIFAESIQNSQKLCSNQARYLDGPKIGTRTSTSFEKKVE